MQIIVSAKNFALTPSIKNFVEQKIGRLEHFWSDIIRAHVELSLNRHHKHGDIYIAFARLETPGPDLRASTESSDMRSAIDRLYPKLERQVVRAKQSFRE